MGALRSKEINDYEMASVEDLRPDESVPVDLHLYFQRNGHLMIWRKAGDFFSKSQLDNFRTRGISAIWIHQQDHEAFLAYLKGPVVQEAPPAPEVPKPVAAPVQTPAPIPTPVAKSEEAQRIIAAIKKDPQATREASKEGQGLLASLGKAATPAEQALATQKARKVIQEVMGQLSHEAGKLIQEIWEIAELDVHLQHSVNVATYATIFALAFGRIEEDLLGDVALASLLHDIGASQVPFEIASKPWRLQSDSERASYAKHVESSLSLLRELSDDIGSEVSLGRVRDIIGQHHEKFDGSGYPKGLEGFRLDDIPQLVALADILDSMTSGRWDGAKRSLTQTLSELQSLEKAKTFPEYFNPEVFATIVRWIQSETDKKLEETTVNLVAKKTKDLVRKVKY